MILKNDMFTVIPEGGSEAVVRVRLNAEHPIYRAHFPGNPITPGVCIVQMIGEVVGDRMSRRLRLRGINNLKFAKPLSPRETPEVDVCLKAVKTDDDGLVKVQGTIADGDTVFTKYSIVYA